MSYDDSNIGGQDHEGSAASQFDLFNQPPEPVTATAVDEDVNLSMPERFTEFHQKNPHVYRALVRLARRFIEATGRRNLGMQRLIEIARWDEQIRTRGEEDFEVNNSFCPYFSRLIMLRETDLNGVFETRRSDEADRWIALVKQGLVNV